VITDVIQGRHHEVILEYAEEFNVDLVVVGTHGRTGFDRYLLGSVTEKLFRTSPVPIMSWAFFYAGVTKVLEPGWSAAGYLGHVAAANGNPLEGLFAWMAATPWFLEFVDVAVPWGELLIGLGLLVGALTRLAALFGALMMLLFYFGNWSVEHGAINGGFAYMLLFLAVAAFGAGRILGLNQYVETYDLGGETLLERFPRLRYVLG